jgi:hypothetical protein
MAETTTGQQLTATLRKSFRVGPRTRDYRDGLSLKGQMLESIENAITYPGYYGPERTELSRAASGALRSYQKHVDGYRIDGLLRFRIMDMTPWQFAALLGEMVDVGITNVGEGERFFAQMARDMHAQED